MKFIVLGGGLTGLSCALTLKKNGHEVVVLEKEAEVGGLTKCVTVDGYKFDYGPHFLFGKPVLLALTELLGTSLELKTLDSSVEKMYFRGRYFNYPFQPKNFLLNLERKWLPGISFDLAIRGIKANLRNLFSKNDAIADSIDCVEDWVINSVGKRIYNYTHLGEYISKLYGLSPRSVSKDWGVQKLKFLRNMNPFALGIKIVAGGSGGERIISYPPLGIDTISHQLEKTFLEIGGKVIVNAKASAVSFEEGNGVKVDYISDEKKSSNSSLNLFYKVGETQVRNAVKGDFLVSTIPVDELTRMLIPKPKNDVLEATAALRYRVLIALLLCVNKKPAIKHGCIYFSESKFPFKRIVEFSNLSEKMAPAGKASLCVEITCFNDDEILRKDDAFIYDRMLTSLEQEGVLQKSEIVTYKILRIPNAYPVYDLSYYRNLETIFNYLSTFKSIVSIGRQGLFSYNTMNNSIRSGLSLGNELSTSDTSDWDSIIQGRYQRRLEKYQHALRNADLRLGDVH